MTQVVSEEGEGFVFHNRLTHSLKVAQCARRLAESLEREIKDRDSPEPIVPEAVEAAALSHDLGHPPFGHTAEVVLNELAERAGIGGFEGNAQSFRIVTRLAFRTLNHEGLNLTRATLAGILKYPWVRAEAPKGKEHKWGCYESEREFLAFAVDEDRAVEARKSMSAEIMDWSDDVTYATHDLDDFFRAGVIPLDQLSENEEERDDFLTSFLDSKGGPPDERPTLYDENMERLVRILELLGIERPFDGSREQRAILSRATSHYLGRYLGAFQANVDEDRLVAYIDPEARREVDLLKYLTWYYVIQRSSLATLRHGQTRIVENLFRTYERASRQRSSWAIFPRRVSDELDRGGATEEGDTHRLRTVVDFIAELTEAQAIGLHRKLCGFETGSLFSPGE